MRVCGPHWRPCCPTLVCGQLPWVVGSSPARLHGALTALSSPERHFQRLGRTLQAATFLDFLWHSMKLPTLHTAPAAL